MADNKNINPEDLDDLLKESFLNVDLGDPKNEKLLMAASGTTLGKGQPTSGSFLKKISGNVKLILAISAVSVITAGTWLYFKNSSPSPLQNSTIAPVVNKQDSTIKQTSPAPEATTKNKDVVVQNTNVVVKPNGTITKTGELKVEPDTTPALSIPNYVEPIMEKASNTTKAVTKTTEDTAYRFPVLTDKEIAANNKQKKAMFEEVIKLRSNRFSFVPMGTFKYMGVQVSTMAFYMLNAVVTNLEYRTFLSDLLIQNRKSDFLTAKVDQKQWVKTPGLDYGQYMKENYFSNSTFNIYPVVNISRQGAEMYCKWLADGVNEMMKEKNKAGKYTVRIPTDVEWYYAASSCDKDTIYPWPSSDINSPYRPSGKDKPTNKRGCFLANFCLKKYTESTDSMKSCSEHPFKNAYTTAGYLIGENMYMAPILSYNPNRLGLFCMSGNAAEMVTVQMGADKNKPGTKGGSWGSDAEHLKLNSSDEYAGQTGPSPFIGFRPIITVTK
jgi:formylglycine-generating enzyme required for sulfatase activity